MAKKRTPVNTVVLLQLIIGLFFIVIGLQGINAYNSTAGEVGRFFAKAFGGKEHVTDIIVAILELIAGIIIVGALFIRGKTALLNIAFIAVMVFWAIQILYVYFLRGAVFEPAFLAWSGDFLQDAVIFMAIWIVWQDNT